MGELIEGMAGVFKHRDPYMSSTKANLELSYQSGHSLGLRDFPLAFYFRVARRAVRLP